MPSLETQSIWHFQFPVCVSFLLCVVLLFCWNKWIEAHTKSYPPPPPPPPPVCFVPCPWRCREYISKAASVLHLATACYFWLHFSSVQDDIYVLGIAYMRSAPSLRRFPSVAFETVLVLLSLTGWPYCSFQGSVQGGQSEPKNNKFIKWTKIYFRAKTLTTKVGSGRGRGMSVLRWVVHSSRGLPV